MKNKLWIAALAVTMMAGCSSVQNKAVTIAGSSDGDALITAGKVVSDTAEVGITGVKFNSTIDGMSDAYAAGPYAVYLVPTPEDIGQDWQPFAGGAMLMTLDGELDFVPKMVAGVIYKPFDALSPYYMAEKAFPSGSVDSPNIAARDDNLFHWFGLRYRFR